MGDVRGTRAFKALAAKLRAEGQPCHLCGHAIDYSIKGAASRRHPWSFVADHVIPVSRDPSLALEPSNLRAAHRWCNGSKGNRAGLKRRDNSRRW